MIKIKVSQETFENLSGLRREGETLTQTLERMALALKESGVVVTGPGKEKDDAWKRG